MTKRLFASLTLILFMTMSAKANGLLPYDPYPRDSGGPSGAQHYYSVLLRGNGEAVVEAKLIFENQGEAPLEEFEFQLEDVTFSGDSKELLAVQELRRCKVNSNADECDPTEPPVYTGDTYWYDITFSKLKDQVQGDLHTLTLVEPVAPGGGGAVLVRFRTFSYTGASLFGRRKVVFKTFAVDHELKKVQVGLSVDTDLYIKGGKAKVDYQETWETADGGAGQGIAAGMALDAPQTAALSSMSNSIVRGGQITKTAQELAAEETLKVKGTYATTKLGLYWSQLLIALLVIAALVWLIVFWVRRRQAAIMMNNPEGKPPRTFFNPFTGSLLLSFGNAAAVLLIASIIQPLGDFFMDFIPYGPLEPVLGIALVIVALAIFAALTLGPSIYFGMRHGKKYGFFAFGFFIGWLIVDILVLTSLFSADYPPPDGYIY